MKNFLEFSLAREKKVFIQRYSEVVSGSHLSKSIKNKSQTVAFLKPRLLSSFENYFPALLLSNGSLVFLNTEIFGKGDRLKTGTLLFEDSYSEKDQWGWF
jgi:hypothetical protein